MLGQAIEDPAGVESASPMVRGLGWLPLVTRFESEKITRLRTGTAETGAAVRGYEIRHGRCRPLTGWREWLSLNDPEPVAVDDQVESACDRSARVFGTSLHGVFEEDRFRGEFLGAVARTRGKTWRPSGRSFAAARERQIDRVADACAAHLDIDALWRILEGTAPLKPVR